MTRKWEYFLRYTVLKLFIKKKKKKPKQKKDKHLKNKTLNGVFWTKCLIVPTDKFVPFGSEACLGVSVVVSPKQISIQVKRRRFPPTL